MRSKSLNLFSIIIMSVCAGLSLGVISGMSSAPVAGALISGAISAAPAIFFVATLQSGTSNINLLMRRFIRSFAALLISVFFVSLVTGVFGGIYVRQNNFFQPPPYKVEVNDLIAAGFDAEEAKALFKIRFTSAKIVDGPKNTQVHFSLGTARNTQICTNTPTGMKIKDSNRIVDFFASESDELGALFKKDDIKTALDRLSTENVFVEDNREKARLIFLEGAWHVLCANKK